MASNPHPIFKYHFRACGSRIAGPVRYAIAGLAGGSVLVGRSHQGICAIFLGEHAPELRRQLDQAFPHVERVEDDEALRRELAQVSAFFDSGAADEPIELDVGGTAFQQKVWQALCTIPPGETSSYAEVAERLGAPGAARAVAGACAANVLAIAIPCHRVVRGDGSISGYRWGVERKRALLAKEAG